MSVLRRPRAFAGALALLHILSCSPQGPGSIPLGAVLPLTGDAAVYGVPPRNGLQLAVDEINADGGIDGSTIDLTVEDDRCDPTTGVNAALKLISQDDVLAIIGAVCSSVTLAIAPTANSHEVVLLSPQSAAPKITEAGDYVFRNWPSDTIEATAAARFTREYLKADAVAVFYITNDYGMGNKAVFEEAFNALGGQILISEGFAEGTTNFQTQIARVRDLKPDVLYLASYLTEAARILVQSAQLRLEVSFVGPIGLLDDSLFALAGEAANGLYVSAPAYDPGSHEQHVQRFVRRYTERFGETPNSFAAAGYDAAKILASVITEVGADRREIKNALYAIQNFQGVSGLTSFDENGDVQKPARMLLARDGTFEPLRLTASDAR